jgi:hypothetical protein
MSRRTALSAPAAMVLAAGRQRLRAEDQKAAGAVLAPWSPISRARETRGSSPSQLHRELKTDLFEILPATPYPEDYEQTVEQARQERDAGVRPPLKAAVPNIAAYDTVFLCFPIWGETAPPIIRSFLAAHDLSGKTVRPVITHGGYGLGDSLAVLKSHAPNARLTPAFSMEADQERRTMIQVRDWLGQIARA